MTDERKPLAPDRPGLYELRNREIGQINGEINDIWHGFITRSDSQQHASWYKAGKASMQDLDWDITARAPDDAAWCLAQARLLCPEGYAVVPVSHVVSPELARQTLAQLMHVAKCNCWACNTFRVIASAAEGK